MQLGSRVLQFTGDQTAKQISIDVFMPEQDPSGGWSCRYTIGWPHGLFESRGWGSDALQAVSLTMKKIGSEIYTSPYH